MTCIKSFYDCLMQNIMHWCWYIRSTFGSIALERSVPWKYQKKFMMKFLRTLASIVIVPSRHVFWRECLATVRSERKKIHKDNVLARATQLYVKRFSNLLILKYLDFVLFYSQSYLKQLRQSSKFHHYLIYTEIHNSWNINLCQKVRWHSQTHKSWYFDFPFYFGVFLD